MTRITRRRFVRETAVVAGAGVAAGFGLTLPGGVVHAAGLPTRAFGKTGVEVSTIGVGGGGRFFEPVPSDEAAAELVRQAIAKGMTFIETAANYGPPEDPNCSERRIGLAMKTHRSRVFLETKIDARDYDGAMREMERSVKLLQTDHVDLMLHHNMGRGDLERILAPNGADAAVRKMVDQKVVRYRGFSCHDPALTLTAIHALAPDAIQSPINATRVPDFEAQVLPLTRQRGIAVIAMKTCGHGFFKRDALGGKYDSRFQSDRNPELHRFAPPEEAFARAYPSADEFTRYALSLPIATAVVGLDSMATLEALIGVAARAPLRAAEAQAIHERAQVFASTGYWIPRAPRRG